MMDPNHRPMPSAYYPSPPSHEDNHSPNNVRAYPGPITFASQRESMPPPPPPISTSHPGAQPIPIQHATSPSGSNPDRSPAPVKQNRLSKACDGCSVRKVKCDEEGPPCRACRSLQIPCTFNRPSRRRGPPNRHAEAIKKQKLEFDANHGAEAQQSGSPTTWDVSPTATAASPSFFGNKYNMPKQRTAEAICPLEILTLLVDDFFVYIHPLHPFPHEPTFKKALNQDRQDTRDPRFLALLASMIGALASSYPRRPLKRLKDRHSKHLFPTSFDLVNRCRDICLEARGTGFYSRKDLGIPDAATSYFLGLMATNCFTVSEGELYFGECFNLLRSMGYQRYFTHEDGTTRAPEFGQAPTTPQHANLIDREVAFRLYWSLFIFVRSAFTFAFGSGIADIHFNPNTPLRRHPPLPVEVDDVRIFADRIDPQPENHPSTVAAFNTLCRVHLAYEPIKAWKLSWAVDERLDRDKQNEMYVRCIAHSQQVFEEMLPTEYQLGRAPSPQQPGSHVPGKLWEQQQQGQGIGSLLSPSIGTSHQLGEPSVNGINGMYGNLSGHPPVRHIAREVQKANVHITYLTAKSFYLEKYWTSNGLAENIIGMTIEQVQAERLYLARQMLDVLSQIHPWHMEPNSFGFCMKIRQVASTLYTLSATVQRNGHVKVEGDQSADQGEIAQAYLREFLKILTNLEKGGRGLRADGRRNTYENFAEEMNDEDELRTWADLRHCFPDGGDGNAGGVAGSMEARVEGGIQPLPPLPHQQHGDMKTMQV